MRPSAPSVFRAPRLNGKSAGQTFHFQLLISGNLFDKFLQLCRMSDHLLSIFGGGFIQQGGFIGLAQDIDIADYVFDSW